MSKITMVFGVALAAIGAWGYWATGSTHPTALIPLWFGVALALAGWMARTADTKRHALWMHFAVTLGLLGFLGTVKSLIDEVRMLTGTAFDHPVAVQEKAGMSVVCLIFVALCVNSFITARKARRTQM